MKAGDVVVGILAGAVETKVRPAVVIASSAYLVGLRAESYFRVYVLTMHRSEVHVIGHLTDRDWEQVRPCVRTALAL